MDLPRGTDVDVDAHGCFYVSSWAGGSFTYSGPNVGYVLCLTPKNHKPSPLPDLKKLDEYDLVAQLASPSATRRMAAQREILHRGDKTKMPRRLKELAWSDLATVEAVSAAVFTLAQLTGNSEGSERVSEAILRTAADHPFRYPEPLWDQQLASKNPRIRLVAAWVVGQDRNQSAAESLVPLLADPDPSVAHVAANSLVRLEAVEECLNAIDAETPQLAPGAVRVLQRLHHTDTVSGLIRRLNTLTHPPLRSLVYRALCRLTFKEAEWDGSWWNTRPDTSGPYYKLAEWEQTARLKQFLRDALSRETGQVQRSLLLDLQRHKIDLPEVMPLAAKLAQSDPTFKQVLVDLLASRPNLTDEHVNLLRPLALGNEEPPALRARAVRLLTRNPESPVCLHAGFDALAAIVAQHSPAPELKSVLEDVTREQRFGRRMQDLVKLTESDQAPRRELAYIFLLNLSRERQGQNQNDNRGRRGAERARELIAQAQADPARAESLQRARSRLGLKSEAPASTTAQTMKGLDYAKAYDLVKDLKGDPKAGAALYAQLGCANCHTVHPNDPPKGPYLGDVATRYGRGDLLESILTPSSKIAQGFETQYFRTKKGDVTEGFVTRESADEVEYRDVNGNVHTVKKSDIDRRGGREQSVMPEALADNFTPEQLASLLAYIESLK
jgi:putative heme-binding domain-containing protein